MRKLIIFTAFMLLILLNPVFGDAGNCERDVEYTGSCVGDCITSCRLKDDTDEDTCKKFLEGTSSSASYYTCKWKPLKENWVTRSEYQNYDWEQCVYSADCNEKYICTSDLDCGSNLCAKDNMYRAGNEGVCTRPQVASPDYDSNIEEEFTMSVEYPGYCGDGSVEYGITAMKRRFSAGGESSVISHYDPFAVSEEYMYMREDTAFSNQRPLYTSKIHTSCASKEGSDYMCPLYIGDSESYSYCSLISQDKFEELCSATANVQGNYCFALRWGEKDYAYNGANYQGTASKQMCHTHYKEGCDSNYCEDGGGECSDGCVLKDNFPAQGPLLKVAPITGSQFYDGSGYTSSYYFNLEDQSLSKSQEYPTSLRGNNNYCLYSPVCTYETAWRITYTNNLWDDGKIRCLCNAGRCFSTSADDYCADPDFSAPSGIVYDLSTELDSCSNENSGWEGKKAEAIIKSIKFSDDEGNFCKIDNCEKKLRMYTPLDDYIVFDWSDDYLIYDVSAYAAVFSDNGKLSENLDRVKDSCYYKGAGNPVTHKCVGALKFRGSDYLGLGSILFPESYINCPVGWSDNDGYSCFKNVLYGEESRTHVILGWVILDLGETKSIKEASIEIKATDVGSVDNTEFVVYSSDDLETWENPIYVKKKDSNSDEVVTFIVNKNLRYFLLTATSQQSNEWEGRLSDGETPYATLLTKDFKYKESDYDARSFEDAEEYLCEFMDNDASADDSIINDGNTFNDCPVYDVNDDVMVTVEIENIGEVDLNEPGFLLWMGELEFEGIDTKIDCDNGDSSWCWFARKNEHNGPAMQNSGATAVYWFPALADKGPDFIPKYNCERVYESGGWDEKLSVGEFIRISCWFDKEMYDVMAKNGGYNYYVFDAKYDVGADGNGVIATPTSNDGTKAHIVLDYSDRFSEIHSHDEDFKVERKSGDEPRDDYPTLDILWDEKSIENVGFRFDSDTILKSATFFTTRSDCWEAYNNGYLCKGDNTGTMTGTFGELIPGKTYELKWTGYGDGAIIFDGKEYAITSKTTDIEERTSVSGPIFFQAPESGKVEITIEDDSETAELFVLSINFKYDWAIMQGNVFNTYTDGYKLKRESFVESDRNPNMNTIVECDDCFVCQFMDTKDKFAHRWLLKNKLIHSGRFGFSINTEEWYYYKWAGLVFVNQPVHKTSDHVPNKLFMQLDEGDYFVTDLKMHAIEKRTDVLEYGVRKLSDPYNDEIVKEGKLVDGTDKDRKYYANNSEISGSSFNCGSGTISVVAGETCLLSDVGSYNLLLEGVQPILDNFNKGWYMVEFTAVSDHYSFSLNEPRFMYLDEFYVERFCSDNTTTGNPCSIPEACETSETYCDGNTLDEFEVYSKLVELPVQPVDIRASFDGNSVSLSSGDRFEIPLLFPDILEGYDIGCFVIDKNSASFMNIFYRAFIYRLRFKTFYNMLVEEFSDYTVPIKIKVKDEPNENWDQPTARLTAKHSIGTILETNPNIEDNIGCISKTVYGMSTQPDEINYITSRFTGDSYSIIVFNNDGSICIDTGDLTGIDGDGSETGSVCSVDPTIQICVNGDQAELDIDFISLLEGDTTVHADDFEGITVIDRVIGENCPNNYCDWSLGETTLTCSDCRGICEENGYLSATYNCPANLEITKETPGCYQLGENLGDYCTTDCHCGDIIYDSETDFGVCTLRNKCAPLAYSKDIQNEVIQKCGSIPDGVDCANYGRIVAHETSLEYECLDENGKSVSVCTA